MRNIERRMRILEAKFPEPVEPSELEQLLPFMSLMEKLRIYHGWKWGLLGTPDFERDAQVILSRAMQRHEAGWSRDDIDELNDREHTKRDGQWHLQQAFAERHPGSNPDPQRFDTLDLEPEEIDQLAAAVRNTTDVADLIEVESLIELLRIDGRKTSTEAFAVIMIEGQLPESPRPMALPN